MPSFIKLILSLEIKREADNRDGIDELCSGSEPGENHFSIS